MVQNEYSLIETAQIRALFNNIFQQSFFFLFLYENNAHENNVVLFAILGHFYDFQFFQIFDFSLFSNIEQQQKLNV